MSIKSMLITFFVAAICLGATNAAVGIYTAKLVSKDGSKASGSVTITIVDGKNAFGEWTISNVENVYAASLNIPAGGPSYQAFSSNVNGKRIPFSVTGKFKSQWTFDPSAGNLTGHLASGHVFFAVHTTQSPNGTLKGNLNSLSLTRAGDYTLFDQAFNIPIGGNVAKIPVSIKITGKVESIIPPRASTSVSVKATIFGKTYDLINNGLDSEAIIKDVGKAFDIVKPEVDKLVASLSGK